MTYAQQQVVPMSIDLHSLVRRSVASLYSHLVTRPTGRALRLGIESQIIEIGSCCLSVLDFTQVVVLDYSCADEVVAKLLLRYRQADRPAEAYFIARGLSEQHREPIDTVLARHNLALVTHDSERGFDLIGSVTDIERRVWSELCRLRHGTPIDLAERCDLPTAVAAHALTSLAALRAVLHRPPASTFFSLATLLDTH